MAEGICVMKREEVLCVRSRQILFGSTHFQQSGHAMNENGNESDSSVRGGNPVLQMHRRKTELLPLRHAGLLCPLARALAYVSDTTNIHRWK